MTLWKPRLGLVTNAWVSGAFACGAVLRENLFFAMISSVLLGYVTMTWIVMDKEEAARQMQNRSNQPKDAPLSREQAINVQRELERQRRKHENHEMMRRGAFRPNMRNSKIGRKG